MHASSRRRPLRAALTSTLLCGALLVTGGAAAQADDRDDHRDRDRHRSSVPTPGERKELVAGLVTPLSLAVDDHDVYVSENFDWTVDKVRRGVATPVVTTPPGTEPGSLSLDDHRLLYTTSVGAGSGTFESKLWSLHRKGMPREIADIGAHELVENPDGGVTYGFTEAVDATCAALLPEWAQPGPYQGILDSHPFATATYRGSVLVADAGANAIFSVDRRGDVDTLAILPPVSIELNADTAARLGLPDCTVGRTFLGEPVPTDVEVGKDGWIYVTSLPGGAGEGPQALPLGAVFKIHPKRGTVELVARGFVGATNLAIGDRGEIYVTELFANRVSVIPRGSSTPQPFLTDVVMPAAVEVEDRALYLTTDALPGPEGPNGKVVKVELRKR